MIYLGVEHLFFSSQAASLGLPEVQLHLSLPSPLHFLLPADAEGPPGSLSAEASKFQPPLPPGTPLSPLFTPPLPKGTPLLTSNTSPHTQRASTSMDEDALTLEELEEQQRQIWAALEQAEGSPSDMELPGDTPFTGHSVASSPCPSAQEPDLPGAEGEAPGKQVSEEPELADSGLEQPEIKPSSPGPEAPEPCPSEGAAAEAESQGALGNGSALLDCDMTNGNSQKPLETDSSPPAPAEMRADASPSPAVKTHSPVPDMSKFATGITPFEFENMAESTGMYLRIRSLLKNSPRNLQKNRKTSE